MIKKVAIYGIGNFGFALPKHFDCEDRAGFRFYAYDRDMSLVNNLLKNRRHTWLFKQFEISPNVIIENNPRDLLTSAKILILAVNSWAVGDVCEIIKPHNKL